MIDIVLIFLALSLAFYVLFGGADFGGGILEVGLGRYRNEDLRRIISHAMAPVWEANHIWLILAVVILFMGFPKVYTEALTYLHLPMMAVLLGIVARGCAFTFRHYDTFKATNYRTYSRIFAYSSLWTSFFLGATSAAFIIGRINPQAQTYSGLFLDPWLNPFCLLVGVFTVCLCALLASVYLMGETSDPELIQIFRRKARSASIGSAVLGPGIFLAAQRMDLPLAAIFVDNVVSLLCFGIGTVLLFFFRRSLYAPPPMIAARVYGVLIVTLVIVAWMFAQYPLALRYAAESGEVHLTFYAAAAPESTLRVLLGSLLVGALLIFPSLAYLFKVFKWQTLEQEEQKKVPL